MEPTIDDATIEVSGVSKSFGPRKVLGSIDLTIASGEFVSLVGASGSGKTTLLRIIAGLESPTTGTIRIDGEPPDRSRATKSIGFVPQSPGLLPWRTVRENARLLLDLNSRRGGREKRADAERIEELLRAVGLADFAESLPHQLSGGMQQRVALVRAFALDAPLLLLDEPFAALDEITRAEMRHLLARLCAQTSATVLFVTHSLTEAVYLSDRVGVLSDHPGTIAAIEPIALPQPRTPDIEDSNEFFDLVRTVRHRLSEARAGSPTEATGPDMTGQT